MELVTVSGRFELPDNSSANPGKMVWQLIPTDIPDTQEPVTVLGGPITVPINSDGSFTVTVRATDDPALVEHVTGDLAYRVSRRLNGSPQITQLVTVPSPGPWNWTELSPGAISNAAVVPVPGPPGPMGLTGPQGIQGPQGPIGATGVAGGSPYTVVATYPNLPLASANIGKGYYVSDIGVIYVSNGTTWRIIYGDTGWRNIASWDAAGVITGIPLGAGWKPRTAFAGYVRIRRMNNTVYHALGQIAVAVAMSADSIYDVPAGFRTDVTVANAIPGLTVGNVLKPFYIQSNANNLGRGASAQTSVDDFIPYGLHVNPTGDGWPATLPGTAVGTVP